MDKTASTALEASIKAWEAKLVEDDPREISVGISACPLCREYSGATCKGCPISLETGLVGCSGTPFLIAVNGLEAWRSGILTKEDCAPLFQRMIDFMKGLRDE